MAGKRGSSSSSRRYPRVARVNEVLREIIALELERIEQDDERLELVTVTGVETDSEIKRAIVYFSSLGTSLSSEEVVNVLNEYRVSIQSKIGKNVRFRNTPQLVFRPDVSIEQGQIVDEILTKLKKQSDD